MASLSPGDRLNELWLPVTNRFLRDGLEGLRARERCFFLVFSMVGEMANGGLRGYFSSSTGHFAPLAAEMLQQLGCARAETALRQALNSFPGSAPQEDWEARQGVLDHLGDDAIEHWQRLSEIFREEEDEVLQRLEQHMSGAPEEGLSAGA
jgi:hypothetical protein